MPYFDKNRDIRKVELLGQDGLPNGYWVTLRHLTVEEDRKLAEDADKAGGGSLAMRAAGEQSLLLSIWDWNLTEDDGNGGERKALITQAYIDKMARPDYLLLAQELSQFEGVKVKDNPESVKAEARFSGGAVRSDTAQPGGPSGVAAIPEQSAVVAQAGAPVGGPA